MQKRRLAAVMWVVPLLMGQTKPAVPATDGRDAEIARLRAENEQLKGELERVKAQVAAKAQAVPTATGSATAPATQAKAKVFTTMLEILPNAPAELRPQANADWYKFTEGKFRGWWEEQIVGREFDQQMKAGRVRVMRNVSPQPGAEWVVTLAFDRKPFTYFGADHSWVISVPSQLMNEAQAKKWDGLNDGMLIKVKGTIRGVRFERTNLGFNTALPVYRVILDLKDVMLVLPGEEAPKATVK